jgi:hypothetical protein
VHLHDPFGDGQSETGAALALELLTGWNCSKTRT